MADHKNIPVLENAWTYFAQLDEISLERSDNYRDLRRWVYILGILATLFAILTQIYPEAFPVVGGLAIKIILVALPILASAIAAYVNKFYASGDWLVARAGAEEVLKEIFAYRTILAKTPGRREWLEGRLSEIKRQVYRGLGGELILKAPPKNIPPYYTGQPDGDPGFDDLSGEEYFRFRLQDQINFHTSRLTKYHNERVRLQIFTLLAGATGAILAAIGSIESIFSLFVAFTAAIVAALIGWQELRNIDMVVRNYSKVVLELSIIRDHWKGLEPEERTDAEFYKMVSSTEDILWAQNVEYIKSMQEVLLASKLEEASLIDKTLADAVAADKAFKQSLRDNVTNQFDQSMVSGQATLIQAHAAAIGSLAEEASSDIVRGELAAMAQAVTGRPPRLEESLQDVAGDVSALKPNRQTPKKDLNQVISRFPPSGELKG